MKKPLHIALTILLLLAAGFLPAQQRRTITISGSDTMNLLTQRLAEEFMKTRPGLEISVRGGGSGVGISDLMEGLNDIAQASRRMKEKEYAKAREKGLDPVEHVIALDAIAVAVNDASPVHELTMNQLKAIYVGAVKRWNELDPAWPDEPILVYSRESNCGTYDFFKETVLGDADFTSRASYLQATAAIANSVVRDRNAIGFGGVAYFVRPEGLRVVAIRRDRNSPAVSPVTAGHKIDYEAVQSGQYPISRTLQFYTPREPRGDGGDFLEWALSPAGQSIVEAEEYIPLSTPSSDLDS